jgi:preprotein translocase subunit SecE
MSTLRDKILGIRTFVDETVGEMKKSTWPTFGELMESTVVVLVALVLLAAYIGVSDKILVTAVQWLIPGG